VSARGVALMTLAVVIAPLLFISVASAQTDTPRTYRGFSYGALSTTDPTADKPQSKLWFHDGAWWALMLHPDDASIRVTELMADHTWRATGAVVDERPGGLGDVLWDGTSLYVASSAPEAGVRVSRLAYDEGRRQYAVDDGFPIEITAPNADSATIAKDSEGRLWVGFTRSSGVWVTHTTSGDAAWAAPFEPVPDMRVARNDVSAIIAFGGNVGIMWSDQTTDSFRFAVHRDDAPEDDWSVETALQGTAMADDHLNVKNLSGDSSGRLFAAVKTAQGDNGEPLDAPLILVLTRSVQGTWSSEVAGTVADNHSRPLLLLDEGNDQLYLFATSPAYGGVLYYKTTALSNISFSPGRGQPFVGWPGTDLRNATVSKEPVNATTGVVVLASSSTEQRYYHAELALPTADGQPTPAALDDTDPPTIPQGVTATATGAESVTLSWLPASDGDHWWPGANEVPVSGYTVYRDGSLLATTTLTSYGDATAEAGRTYEYSVDAFDAADNHSARADPVSVQTPEQSSLGEQLGAWVPLVIVGVLAAGSAYVVYRLRRRRGRYALVWD
jgi:hypothetical protein